MEGRLSRQPVVLGVALALLLGAADASALTGTICTQPGVCTTAWAQGAMLQNISTTTGVSLYQGTGACSIGANCYTNPAPSGLPLNLYVEFMDDATTPWTTAQKQMWVALLSSLGSTQWFAQTAAMYPPTSVWGAQSTGATLSLTNCLSGAPAHCGDFTYSPGSTGVCPDISLPSDQYGIYLKVPSAPNVTSGGLAGANAVSAPNGHCVFAGQTISAPTPLCWGGGNATPTVQGTVNSFTMPAVSSTVTITLATGNFLAGTNTRQYVETAGWFIIATGGGTSSLATNLGTPVNAAPGTVIATGQNVEHLPVALTPNGCVLDNEINLAVSELFAAITNFHGEGWGQYAIGVTCPPCPSPGPCLTCSHEQCLNAATNGIPNNDFLLVPGTQVATALTVSMFSNTYNFLLAGAWANSQATSNPNAAAAPALGYCFGRRTLADYWNQPCAQNSDCPAASGVCSGVGYGNHCQAPSCSDGVKNGFETDIDCGGWCNPCNPGQGCASMWDCAGGIASGRTDTYCVSGVCTNY